MVGGGGGGGRGGGGNLLTSAEELWGGPWGDRVDVVLGIYSHMAAGRFSKDPTLLTEFQEKSKNLFLATAKALGEGGRGGGRGGGLPLLPAKTALKFLQRILAAQSALDRQRHNGAGRGPSPLSMGGNFGGGNFDGATLEAALHAAWRAHSHAMRELEGLMDFAEGGGMGGGGGGEGPMLAACMRDAAAAEATAGMATMVLEAVLVSMLTMAATKPSVGGGGGGGGVWVLSESTLDLCEGIEECGELEALHGLARQVKDVARPY